MSLFSAEPIISTSFAHFLSFCFASCYVGSIYVSKNARLLFQSNVKPTASGPRQKLVNERWRDDPEVIRARLLSVTTATIICSIAVFLLLWQHAGSGHDIQIVLSETLVRLGFLPPWKSVSLRPFLVTPILFLGPLYARYLARTLPFQKFWLFQRDVVDKFTSWEGLRNYTIAPITEEVAFRACVLSVYNLSGMSMKNMVLLGPLSFGLAHIHHAWDTYNRYGRTADALKRAILSSLFQFAYTTLFGFHCSYLFIRTGSIYVPASAHTFCNIMNLPAISYELRTFPQHKTSIIIAYTLGIFGFIYTLTHWM